MKKEVKTAVIQVLQLECNIIRVTDVRVRKTMRGHDVTSCGSDRATRADITNFGRKCKTYRSNKLIIINHVGNS